MRLINTVTLEYQDFFDTELPKYAILSHCWGEREASYQDDLRLDEGQNQPPYLKKIFDSCTLAKGLNIDWIWVDTCCIDKSSSAELSEAINSMFSWYQRAHICFVFLYDLPAAFEQSFSFLESLSRCRWFTRGWTLQELIAPSNVHFYGSQLNCIGTKSELATELASVTGIPESCLRGRSFLAHYSVAQRMSWASRRSTTRKEDMAYCLLGIFGVNMPLLYGEGTKAFTRLQQSIIAQCDDESIFAWRSSHAESRDMLANSPAEFATTGNIRPVTFGRKRPTPTFTSRGLEIQHSYTHPADGLFERVWESLFGQGSSAGPQQINLRLDCVLRKGWPDHWIGITLRKDAVTGSWYRFDASKLHCSKRSEFFRAVYPSLAGHITIHVTAHNTPRVAGPLTKSRDASITRPIWLTVLLIIAEAYFGSSWLWFVSHFHRLARLPPPNALLSWAYLTIVWHARGSSVTTLEGLILLGWLNWDFVLAYESHNLVTALFATVPMLSLHAIVNRVSWKEL